MKLKLTKAECDMWNWAQSAAADMWADDDGREDGRHFDKSPVGEAVNGEAEIMDDADVIEDMVYRLGTQLPDMAVSQGAIEYSGHADKERMKALGDIVVANRIVKKLNLTTYKVVLH